MRFRASIERDHFAVFFNQIKLLSEVGKQFVLILGQDNVKTTMVKDDDAMQVFSGLVTEGVFTEFKIESKMNNVIGVELLMQNFLHALRSGHKAQVTTIKLTKRGTSPFLSILTQTVEGGVDVLQDVPVRVLSAVELERYAEPMIPQPAVKLQLVSAKAIASVVDRMKTVAKALRIEASQAEKQIIIGVRNETVAIRTFFRDLTADDEGAAETLDNASGPTIVSVSMKHIARILKAMSSMDSSLLVCIVPSHALILHIENADHTTSMTFLLSLQDTGATSLLD